MPGFDHRSYLKTVTESPGVYRMFDKDAQVIYVGKANNLKNRLSSYFQTNISRKTSHLVAAITRIEVTIVNSEVEALILERELIAQYRPKYNVLLRDDKSYPYLLISSDEFPRISSHRGKTNPKKGQFFGPYPNTAALYHFLEMAQKLFKLRNCSNSFFANRSRPCLQYQIQRCSAPCVGRISSDDYHQDVLSLVQLLEGRNNTLQATLIDKMESASSNQEYEKAAEYRDALGYVSSLVEKQFVVTDKGSADVIACAIDKGIAALYVLRIRSGKIMSPEVLYPKIRLGQEASEVIKTYLLEIYNPTTNNDAPAEIIISHGLEEKEAIESVIKSAYGRHIPLLSSVKTQRRAWLSIAEKSAQASVSSKADSFSQHASRFEAFLSALNITDECVEKVSCFDVSHTFGEETVASCVVFDKDGPNKKLYRTYNIKTAKKSDDYGAMKEVFERHFNNNSNLANVVIVDGGKGQLSQAIKACKDAQIEVQLLGVAKGEGRKAGLERLYRYNAATDLIDEISIPPTDKVHHFIQSIRDEAHRFAITTHRRKRDKKRVGTTLEEIPGIGKAKASLLLNHFGSVKKIKTLSPQELTRVKGISLAVAEKILSYLKG
ncbi:MAG: excinuclease ABC subunit C [Legionellales bacterium]|nr:excinuclease ABC subunit C [Legionellales bacterium]